MSILSPSDAGGIALMGGIALLIVDRESLTPVNIATIMVSGDMQGYRQDRKPIQRWANPLATVCTFGIAFDQVAAPLGRFPRGQMERGCDYAGYKR